MTKHDTSDLLTELRWRGLAEDQTPGLAERLARGPITGYVGFDPTAPSLQIGNLVPIMLLVHLQRAGGKPIVVLGGGTGLIGDPSGKRAERPLLDRGEVEDNVERQRKQFELFLDFEARDTGAELVDNVEWLGSLNLVEFLRDIGKHFTLSYMLQKESVKSRLEEGISYTEFSYMLLQAYDFLQLYRTRGCELQLGGSDQWGNITAGRELVRRVDGAEVHGVSAPLITTASGEKFGKSDGLTAWLDPEMTSPYWLYQFWVNTDDRDVDSYLKMFTLKSRDEIADLVERHAHDPGARIPHKALALDVTDRVHGSSVAASASRAAGVLFGDLDPHEAGPEVWATLAKNIDISEEHAVSRGDLPMDAFNLVWSQGFHTSKSELRRLFKQGGIRVNGERVEADTPVTDRHVLAGGYVWLRRGKKYDSLVKVTP
ncbi:MAG: tyrosine--tRNA ligase [Gemmatimonadales bacterium]